MPETSKTHPDVFMIGGPNGAGKTTSALVLLPKFLDVFEFVNADEIARGLNPLNPESVQISAGRTMLERLHDLTSTGKNFAFESTCAGLGHTATLKACRKAGYRVSLAFYWLPSADMAVQRVQARVEQGGHGIPEATIRRRYRAGLRNLVRLYLPLADRALILDNTHAPLGAESEIIAEKMSGQTLKIVHASRWQGILRAAKKGRHE